MSIIKQGEALYAGRVLATYTTVDSLWEQDHYFATVLDENGHIAQVNTGGRQWAGMAVTYPVTVDATEDVINAAAEISRKNVLLTLADDVLRRAKLVEHGRVVRVVKGRKVAKGTEGEVFWAKTTDFGLRVGIKTAAGETHFLSAENVEVANPLDYVTSEWAVLEAQAAKQAAGMFPQARAAMDDRRAAKTGEFEPFKRAVVEAIKAAQHPSCYSCGSTTQVATRGTGMICDACVNGFEEAGLGPCDFATAEDEQAFAQNITDALYDDAPYDSNIGTPAAEKLATVQKWAARQGISVIDAATGKDVRYSIPPTGRPCYCNEDHECIGEDDPECPCAPRTSDEFNPTDAEIAAWTVESPDQFDGYEG